MASDGVPAVWNPAFRPDNSKDLIATDLSLDVDSKEPIAEITSSSPDASTVSEELEAPNNSTLSAPNPPIRPPETTASDVTRSEPWSLDENPAAVGSLEEPESNDEPWETAQMSDDHVSQPLDGLGVPEESSVDASGHEIEEATTILQTTADPFSTADQDAGSFFEGGNGAPRSGGPETRDDSVNADGAINSFSRGLWGSPTNEDAGDDFFDQLKTQTKPIYIPPETESRFEEGVPLLHDSGETPVEESENNDIPIDNIFDGDEDDEGAFFKEIQSSEPAEKEPQSVHIARKSTTQVLESLDVPPYSPACERSPTAQEFNNDLAAVASDSQLKPVSSDEDLAARWQAELSHEPTEKAAEEDLAARWQAELDDDDDLLLGDEDASSVPEANIQGINGFAHDAVPVGLGSPLETHQTPAVPTVQSASYTPHQPSTSDLLQGIQTQGVAPQAGSAHTSYFAPQPPSNAQESKAVSFSERSKEGYKSPYDLPVDLTRPRRPVYSHKTVVAPGSNMPPPPTRSSSMPVPPQTTSTLPASPMGASPGALTAEPKNFYEELPLPPPIPRSRPATAGRYTPNVSAATVPPSRPLPPTQGNQYGALSAVAQQPSDTVSQPQLQPPERVDPYANLLAPGAPSAPAVPSAPSRYSPKPPALNTGTMPFPSPRYSPAPPPSAAPPPPKTRYASQPSGGPGQGASLPFQPRTSSPLAYHEKVSYQPQEGFEKRPSLEQTTSFSPSNGPHTQSYEQEAVHGIDRQDDTVSSGPVRVDSPESMPTVHQPISPPRNRYAPSGYADDNARWPAPPASSFSTSAPPAGDSQFAPPRRSQTQSPSQQMLGPKLPVPSADPFQRPASVHGSGSPTKVVSPYAPSQVSVHNRVASQPLEFIPPEDGQQFDPLERWRGAPIVKFGLGGSITTCFPKHIPRYSAGQAAPKIKSSPGEIRIHQFNDWIPTLENIVHHPGPLKNKSKKKDLLAWLSSKVVAFENEGITDAAQLHPDSFKRHEEKILLWKVVKFLVEHDGNLDDPTQLQSLRNIIFPHLQSTEPEQNYGDAFPAPTSLQPLDGTSRPDTVDPQSLESVRSSLLVGDREKAVWTAVDHRLWGHAMIIASTLDKSVWKQVVQEFVRREVRSATSNTEPLAALYEVFAGNVEESIDELVPPSARAGLQMINKVDGQGTSKNALDGLNSWKETFGLVLSNRSPDDHRALLALGRLLLSYGRIEAAHICFIFSRAAVFAGADDPQASVVLLGADHRHLSSNILHDHDPVLLTEAYEYATSVLAGSPMTTLPHLLAFKLIYAWSLAERGRNTEALQYCDAIAAALKATTKPSVYHHQHLYFGVDELSSRLRQTTHDEGSSWISRPSMEKVSGSMWAKFNSFVSGEDSDAASTGSGKAGDGDVGPFAKLAGTPTVSRSPSVSDIYGPYASATQAAQPIPSGGPSRYQPSTQYVPSSSPEQMRGARPSFDSQRSSSYGFSSGQRRGSQEPATPIDNNLYQGGPIYNHSPPVAGYQGTPPQTSYIPLAPVEEDSIAQPYAAPIQGSPVNVISYQPPGNASFGPSLTQLPTTTSQPTSGGYMPPVSSGGYEPPSADNNVSFDLETTEESGAGGPMQKKKSFMDDEDDDDFAARAAAVQKAEKERKDREANDAVRKAAEADAQRPAPAKKSWFGGWFGGKKEENPGAQGPIRAKLGEENSFYYDNELKKWVNKKDPNSSTVTRGAPPPPKGQAPPSRTASGSSAPPLPQTGNPGVDRQPSSSIGAPPSLSSSPAPPSLGAPPSLLGATARSVSTGAAAPTPLTAAAGLPPRPATSLSNASSIDDLLGAPQARKGNTVKGKKKGRYVDVMAK
ncbi:hypothetical protein EYZ11_002342 [Aspergillus tanneri]|uniref:Protein transport protein sec16 n=1 Tax=Aspergillus tanneri TaxID=1220188 RepID=A0A4S3JR63_9EURO|nr:vesicle coat component [Aspergillus tanneri]KAA8643306.1 vesicle coat component [Aspergillus tanneri]THC98186.1 hypothetical protein EYZ11_002342 [Aspergillus tanneri]